MGCSGGGGGGGGCMCTLYGRGVPYMRALRTRLPCRMYVCMYVQHVPTVRTHAHSNAPNPRIPLPLPFLPSFLPSHPMHPLQTSLPSANLHTPLHPRTPSQNPPSRLASPTPTAPLPAPFPCARSRVHAKAPLTSERVASDKWEGGCRVSWVGARDGWIGNGRGV